MRDKIYIFFRFAALSLPLGMPLSLVHISLASFSLSPSLCSPSFTACTVLSPSSVMSSAVRNLSLGHGHGFYMVQFFLLGERSPKGKEVKVGESEGKFDLGGGE